MGEFNRQKIYQTWGFEIWFKHEMREWGRSTTRNRGCGYQPRMDLELLGRCAGKPQWFRECPRVYGYGEMGLFPYFIRDEDSMNFTEQYL